MTKLNLFKPTFLISLLVGFIGAFLKIMHLPGGQIFIVISVILTVVYVISAFYEIYGSRRITMNEKVMWTIGFILLSTITGLLYFFMGRPRILRDYKILNHQDL
jgi:tellurite resistance protein TehA-like permease